MRLSGGRLVIGDSSAVASQSLGGEGVAGDVILDGGTIAILGGGSIQSFNQSFTGAGRGGNIDLLADSIEISGQSEFGGASLVLSGTDTAGDGGRISIRTPSLVMNGGQILSSASFGEGPNGERPGGAGGSIDVDVGQLSMAGGALMRSFVSTTVPGVPGRGGAVTVSVDGHADVSGFGSGIFSFASNVPVFLMSSTSRSTVPLTGFTVAAALSM